MIQSISAMRAAVASAELALPTPARAADGGPPTDGRQLALDTIHGFGERMQLASSESETLSDGFSVALLQGALPDAAVEQGRVMQLGGAATQGAEAPQELTPEQWLLGMIDQQLAEIRARDAGRLGAASAPVPQALPTAGVLVLQALPVATASPADELLARTQGQNSFVGPKPETAQTAQADPLQALMTGGFQRQAAEANLVMSAMPKPTAEESLGLPVAAPATSGVLPTAALEPLLNAAEPLEAGDPLISAVDRAQATPAQAADRALKLQAPETKWGEQMLHALRENVDLQIQQKIQRATIRLDPPELGSMEIMLSHESGRLNVHLTAANADVARLLQQTSDRLRHELVGQHFVQVNVQVGADSGGQQGQQRQRAALAGEELPLAARPHEQEQSRESGRARDVLITV